MVGYAIRPELNFNGDPEVLEALQCANPNCRVRLVSGIGCALHISFCVDLKAVMMTSNQM